MGDAVSGDDRDAGGRERAARDRLVSIADDAGRATGVRATAPSAIDLVLAHARAGRDVAPGEQSGSAEAALVLMPEAYRELERAELVTIDAAREAGLSWRVIAAALGLQSPQAGQQRRERLRERTGRR